MANNNETIAEIVREMFEYPKSWGEYNHLDWKALAKRIQEAHDHELDVQYGRILRLVDKLAAKDAEIAELRCRLKVAEEFAAEMKESTNSLVRACGHQMILRIQGEGVNDAN